MAPLHGTVVCIVVSQGATGADALADAVARLHPSWAVGAVWCGDPQRRPRLETPWWDTDVRYPEWEHVLVSSPPHTAEWRRTIRTVEVLLAGGAGEIVVLWAGAVAVLGDLSSLCVADGVVATVVPRVLSSLPEDGLAPDEADLIDAGRFSTTVVAFGTASRPMLERLGTWLADDPRADVGRWLEAAVAAFPTRSCNDPAVGVGLWRWDVARPALLDVPTFDERQPWVLDPEMTGAGRIGIVSDAQRAAVVAEARPQLVGHRVPVSLPGGSVVDDVMRGVLAESARQPWDEPPPRPWSDAARFRLWLEQRYWTHLHSRRHDLAAAFPQPTGRDADAFREWATGAFAVDDVPFLLSSRSRPRETVTVAPTLRRDGINLVGYLSRDSSLGDVARRIGEGLRSAGVATSTIASQRTASPPLADGPPIDQRVAFETSLAVVTADQFPLLAADHPQVFAHSTRMIGYWFWELEHVPEPMRAAIDLVDEIWAGSRFVTDAIAAVSRVPVRHVPIPIPEPVASDRELTSFAALAPYAGRFVFLMSFDHLSVTERKNPVGAIEAFTSAFAPGEGPVLVVKTMNGRLRWRHHQRVLAAAAGRPDVVVWDAHLDRADHMALVKGVDCVVSLHRSEGLGLHLAEAMWLGTPTISTRYSGNLDFLDDECGLLVDYERVHVTGGEGVYPGSTTWADPDVESAASAMRRLVADADLGNRLAVAGRAQMLAQPSLRELGLRIASLVGGEDPPQ